MERPSRSKKPVNYSDIQEFDDDEDFACVKAPPNKKPRVCGKEPAKPASRTASQEAGTHPTNHTERISLDDKLYERDLEAALTLSMLKAPEAVEEPSVSTNDKGGKDRPLSKAKAVSPSLLLSNCSVDPHLLGLDNITDICGSSSAPSRTRKTVSKIAESQMCVQQEERDSRKDEDYQPTCTPDSESDADFSGEDESDDEEFTVKKAEKKPKKTEKPKKEKAARPAAPKKDKKPSKSSKSKLEAAASPISRSPSDAVPVSVAKKPASSPPVSRPMVSRSPAGGRLPKWNPPAQIGRSPSAAQSIQLKSPGQGLRLGLSRLARVKPLHPSAAGQ